MSASKRVLVGLAVGAGVLGLAAPAFADYPAPVTPQGPSVLPATQNAPAPAVRAATQAPTSTLPFTGADVAELTVIGGLAIAGGAVLVRSGRRRTQAAN